MRTTTSPETAKKATWGRSLAFGAALLAIVALIATPAEAQRSRSNPNGQQNSKLDKALNKVADGNGESDVIVEFFDNRDGATVIKGHGGKAGKKLGILGAWSAHLPNAFLKRLADHPNVKRISLDREAEAFVARTSATVGATTARSLYGYSGAGVGVAVIDSGITPWHDDLTVNYRQGQRVAAFVDFVNGQTTAYDDWGHGTHVAGIVAGNGYDSYGSRTGVAPKANLVVLKALDQTGRGHISNIIAALDWAVAHKAEHNIRVVNMSLGAGVFESYNTDPLTQAAKRAVEAGIVVVAAAGNLGKATDGQPQYGAIAAPGNAPWVLTVGASSTNGTIDRRDDTIASYSSRGPTMIDFAAKPDLVAPGTGTVSLSVKGSTLYAEKGLYLLGGSVWGLNYQPYLALSGTSMAAPVVAGSVALMLEANPNLTPNMVKAMLQYTAQVSTQYNYLTQGAGFLNTLGAVRLARFFRYAQRGDPYPTMTAWSRHIFWGNTRVSGGVLTPGGNAWGANIVWGDLHTPAGQNIVWGENCYGGCDNIVWGNNIVWGDLSAGDNIVWGDTDGDNIVWGNGDGDNIVWGNNIVWGDSAGDNIVWGNDCGGADCDNIVWGNTDGDNIVWGNAEAADNIVWGNTSSADNIVWGNSAGDEDVSWGSSADDEIGYGDDTAEVEAFDPATFEELLDLPPLLITDPPPAAQPEGGVL